ncbi:MAG: hypothetical protein ACM3ML_09350 [Micromonosporaceae bacterium]
MRPLTGVLVLHAAGGLTLAQLYAVALAAGALSVAFNVCDSTRGVSFLTSALFLTRIRAEEPDPERLKRGGSGLRFLLGSAITGRLTRRIGVGWGLVAGCVVFPALPSPAPQLRSE